MRLLNIFKNLEQIFILFNLSKNLCLIIMNLMKAQGKPGPIALIHDELRLVNQKQKSPARLQQLLYELQLSPYIPIDLLTSQMVWLALQANIAGGDFLQFENCLSRNFQKLKDYNVTLMSAIAENAECKEFDELRKNVGTLISENKDPRINPQAMMDGIYKFIINQYALNFRNYESSKLEKYGITKKWLLENGYQFDGMFVILPEHTDEQNLQKVLENRIKEVAELTRNIIELGK